MLARISATLALVAQVHLVGGGLLCPVHQDASRDGGHGLPCSAAASVSGFVTQASGTATPCASSVVCGFVPAGIPTLTPPAIGTHDPCQLPAP